MPRQREPDAEDRMARCPKCQGTGRLYRFDLETETDCDLCLGAGRVTAQAHQTYQRP